MHGWWLYIPRPDREAQVVADERGDAPTVYAYEEPFATWSIVFIFAGVAEQVAFVVDAELPVGLHPDEAVEVLAPFFNNQATGEDAAVFCGHVLHPIHGGPVHGFGEAFRFHAEAGGAHFG